MSAYTASLHWLFAQTRAGAKRDPERMRRLIGMLGLRQPLRSIHVVGTNGKGSVSQLIAAGLGAAGLTVGRFSSPHVEDFRERIVIAKEEILEKEVVEFVERVKGLEFPFAFFELSFALALTAFSEHTVDIAVVEAGVGAAKDATKALENVELSVLTNVSLDHRETLGASLEAIARDKAEVMRPHVAFVTAEQNEIVLEILRSRARALNTPFYSLATTPDLFEGFSETDIDAQNKRLVSAALRLLNIKERYISQGLKNASPLPARQEVFLLGDKTVILDGGHNLAAVRALIEKVGQAETLIFGTLAKREGQELFNFLKPHFSHVTVTSVDGSRPEWLESNQRFIPNSLRALDVALKTLSPNGTLLISGSFYLAGQLRPRLRDLAQTT